jgi:decaprenyl-phosphate phosphoribosyltransferase
VTTGAEVKAKPVGLAIRWSPLLAATRPKQWLKNLLVFAAPVAAGVIGRDSATDGAELAFVTFVLASACGYLLNDIVDVERDRAHPEKKRRPIAARTISVSVAATFGALLSIAAVTCALVADKEALAGVVCVYLLVTTVYSLGLKRFAVIELLLLTSGFVLRPLAGAVATNVSPSGWFLLVCSLAALTIVTGKRIAEFLVLGDEAVGHRAVLAAYSVRGLRWLRRLASTLTIVCYAGWALTRVSLHDRLFALCSAIALLVALWRFARCNDRGEAGAPEELLLRDRILQSAAVAWTLLFVLGLGHL